MARHNGEAWGSPHVAIAIVRLARVHNYALAHLPRCSLRVSLFNHAVRFYCRKLFFLQVVLVAFGPERQNSAPNLHVLPLTGLWPIISNQNCKRNPNPIQVPPLSGHSMTSAQSLVLACENNPLQIQCVVFLGHQGLLARAAMPFV